VTLLAFLAGVAVGVLLLSALGVLGLVLISRDAAAAGAQRVQLAREVLARHVASNGRPEHLS
jgi:hypothetical protein